jgi:hypothetical protein
MGLVFLPTARFTSGLPDLGTASPGLLTAAVMRDRTFVSCRPKSTPFVRYKARTAERASCFGRTASCVEASHSRMTRKAAACPFSSTICCNMSRKQAIVAETCVGLALPIFQQSLACLLGDRPHILGKPGLLVDAILGRRIADVDQAHAFMDTRADIVDREGPERTSYGRRL